jgi:hypothetical protein
MEIFIILLAIAGGAVIVLLGLSWLAVVFSFMEMSGNTDDDDLLLDGENFDNKTKSNLRR